MTQEDNGCYSEVALIEIQAASGSAYQYASLIEEFSPQEGEKGGESVSLVNGGRVWKHTPEEDYEITMKLYPIGIESGTAGPEDLVQGFLTTDDGWDGSAPFTQTNTRNRERFRVVFLWTDDATATTAGGATTQGYSARRLIFNDARMTQYKEDWGGDKVLTSEVTFKGPAFNKSGSGRILRESAKSNSGSGLTALSAYT